MIGPTPFYRERCHVLRAKLADLLCDAKDGRTDLLQNVKKIVDTAEELLEAEVAIDFALMMEAVLERVRQRAASHRRPS